MTIVVKTQSSKRIKKSPRHKSSLLLLLAGGEVGHQVKLQEESRGEARNEQAKPESLQEAKESVGGPGDRRAAAILLGEILVRSLSPAFEGTFGFSQAFAGVVETLGFLCGRR